MSLDLGAIKARLDELNYHDFVYSSDCEYWRDKAIPNLVAEVERLNAENSRLRGALERLGYFIDEYTSGRGEGAVVASAIMDKLQALEQSDVPQPPSNGGE